MLGEAGYLSGLPKESLDKMIDIVKAIEPEMAMARSCRYRRPRRRCEEGPINVLTGPHADNATHTPAYKETAVKIEVLPEKGANPLRRLNLRASGKPTPQNGVEVERKWKRADYRTPGTQKLVQIEIGK